MIELAISDMEDGRYTIYNEFKTIYSLFTSDSFPNNICIPAGFKDLIDTIYDAHQQRRPECQLYDIECTYINGSDKDILLAFSGGVDSAYMACRLREQGYNVKLFHMSGLNKHFPKEDMFALNFADKFKFDYVDFPVSHHGKEAFADNPVKNQLILSLMIDYGGKHNITKFAVGSFDRTTLSGCRVGYNITDANEVYNQYMEGVRTYRPNVQLFTIDYDTRKYDVYKYMVDNYPDTIDYVYSCVGAHRFNDMLHKNNSEKYGKEMLPGRCGSCYKCCMEILILALLKYKFDYSVDIDLVNHCWAVLSDSKNRHSDVFNKRLSEDERIYNLINYGGRRP